MSEPLLETCPPDAFFSGDPDIRHSALEAWLSAAYERGHAYGQGEGVA